ncbi:hypothetical protein HM1_0330 [Heliomicrobium modesticaldum Ice1]|uniref:Uncharacterized protein n=1 Tax=Heliobacterium modesticaldum (strain ATCC 51547 / Ice1) TaxID=498761 RepID=B0TEN0_HELMI|nr:hypothetical protein HM1_0330 [Heliomicrobium modesticaldum Ice1]
MTTQNTSAGEKEIPKLYAENLGMFMREDRGACLPPFD